MARSAITNGEAGAGTGLSGFLLLFAALYGAYGALSPFLPAFLQERGLSPQEIAACLAAATLTRLVAGPLVGRLADRTGRTRGVLALFLGLAAAFDLLLLAGHGFRPLLAIGLGQAVATAPVAPLADALALAAARGGAAFEYGWVRAAGSAAFVVATVVTGQLVGAWGNEAGLWACGAGFALAALAAAQVRRVTVERSDGTRRDGFSDLLRNPRFRRVVLAAALVIGAHAMHDAFGVIAWRQAGIEAGTAGLLWSVSVAAEVAVFLRVGPWLIARLGPAGAIVLAAAAGAVRWGVQGATMWLPALVGIQCLHGLTFAALHLSCLTLIEASVPDRLRATALTVYGSVGLGLASALVTLAAGRLYAEFGLGAFWAMSALSLAAVPLGISLCSRN